MELRQNELAYFMWLQIYQVPEKSVRGKFNFAKENIVRLIKSNISFKSFYFQFFVQN
jgi:hypothetical protein